MQQYRVRSWASHFGSLALPNLSIVVQILLLGLRTYDSTGTADNIFSTKNRYMPGSFPSFASCFLSCLLSCFHTRLKFEDSILKPEKIRRLHYFSQGNRGIFSYTLKVKMEFPLCTTQSTHPYVIPYS